MTCIKALLTGMYPLLLALALTTPGTGFASTGLRLLEDAPLPSAEPQGGPRLLELPPEPERTSSPALLVSRIVAEVGGIFAGAFVAGIPGALVGGTICSNRRGIQSSIAFECWGGAGYGFIGGMMVGAPLGAWAGARFVEGQGTLLGAFAGSGVGAGAALVTAYFVTNDDLKPVLFPLFSFVGTLVGYELSHAFNSKKEAAPAVSLQPSLTVGRDGHTLLGMSGQF